MLMNHAGIGIAELQLCLPSHLGDVALARAVNNMVSYFRQWIPPGDLIAYDGVTRAMPWRGVSYVALDSAAATDRVGRFVGVCSIVAAHAKTVLPLLSGDTGVYVGDAPV